MQDGPPFGIAVLDVYQDQWALWQVSVDSFYGRLRASTTNAVVRDRFIREEFESVVGNRQLLLTPRATAECPPDDVAGPEPFDGHQFINACASWIEALDGLFLQENARREEENERRKEAKKAGLPGPFTKLAPLQDIGWPGMPAETEWTSEPTCQAEARFEALRMANGCVRLLDYWLDIEITRTRKNRAYFNCLGGPDIRLWPTQIPEAARV